MPLPEDFSPWEHLRQQLTAAHNLQVEQAFYGIDAQDISTELGAMRTAVFIEGDDTVDMIILRLFLYHFKFRKDLPVPIYGIPVADWGNQFKSSVQVILHFKEDNSLFLTENKLTACTSTIKYKLTNETAATINPAKAKNIANQVKEFMGTGGGFNFMKGPTKVCYLDPSHGLDFKVLAQNEEEGAKLIQLVTVELAKKPFDETLLKTVPDKKTYPKIPPYQEIYGKERRLLRRRPTCRMRFARAEMHVPNLRTPIMLYDRTGKYLALVK